MTLRFKQHFLGEAVPAALGPGWASSQRPPPSPVCPLPKWCDPSSLVVSVLLCLSVSPSGTPATHRQGPGLSFTVAPGTSHSTGPQNSLNE